MTTVRRRVGVFGGTFDPPHVSHAAVGLAAIDQLNLDELLVIPAARPPHRQAVLRSQDRFALTSMLFADVDRARVSRIELDRSGPSWTVDTLRDLQEETPGAALFLIIGQDQLGGFTTWRDWREVLRLAQLVVAPRLGVAPNGTAPVFDTGVSSGGSEVDSAAHDLEYTQLAMQPTALAGAAIRDRLRAGLPFSELAPGRLGVAIREAWSRGGQTAHGSCGC